MDRILCIYKSFHRSLNLELNNLDLHAIQLGQYSGRSDIFSCFPDQGVVSSSDYPIRQARTPRVQTDLYLYMYWCPYICVGQKNHIDIGTFKYQIPVLISVIEKSINTFLSSSQELQQVALLVGRSVGWQVGLSVCLANKNSKQKFSNKISKQNFHTKFSKEISKQISKGNFRTKFPNKHPNKISKQNFQNKFSNKISKRNLQTNLPKVAFKMNRKLLVIFRGGLQTVVILLIWVSQPTPPGFEQ